MKKETSAWNINLAETETDALNQVGGKKIPHLISGPVFSWVIESFPLIHSFVKLVALMGAMSFLFDYP